MNERAKKGAKDTPREKKAENKVTQSLKKKAKQKKGQSFEEQSLICHFLKKRRSLKKDIEKTFAKLNK